MTAKTCGVIAAMLWLLSGPAARAEEGCDKLKPKSAQSSADWQREAAVRDFVCHAQLPRSGEAGARAATWMDRAGKDTSEIARAMFVWQCLPDLKDDAPGIQLSKGMSQFATCSVDARKLDDKALDAEIKALALPPKLAQTTTERYAQVKALAKSWIARVDAAIKKDPAYKKVLLDAPDAAWAAWDKTLAEHKADFDLAYSVEDKALAVPFAQRKTPQTIGCEELRKAWRGYVAGTKPKNTDEVKAAAVDAVAYPLLERLELCDAFEGRYVDAAAEDTILHTGHYAQGPRLAGAWAALDAAQEVKTFSGPYAITGANMNVPYKDELMRAAKMVWSDKVRKLSSFFDGKGAEDQKRGTQGVMEQAKIAKVSKAKDGIQVEFKTEKWEEPDFNCTNTGRIGNFQPDGTPMYIYHCKEAGSHIETYTLKPRLFTASSADGLKPGQIIKVLTADLVQASEPTPSFVVEVLDGVGKKPKTVSYLGISLK
jgi:hypothetical protein